MSVLTPKRLFLCVVAVLSISSSALAGHPSPRAYARMAFDQKNNVAVLFGGRGVSDRATGVTHSSNETWLFAGATWAQRFPQTVPPGRGIHAMDADDDGRVYMFAGRRDSFEVDGEPVFFSDLWRWDGEDWTRLDSDSGDRPTPRQYSTMAYDEERDVVVIYGGEVAAEDDDGDFVVEGIFDTWEFANGTWTRYATDVPKVAKPTMTYDPSTKQIYMLGITNDNQATPLMYRYDGAAHAWTQVTPAKFPSCINEGKVMRQSNGRLAFIGGICRSGTPATDEVWEYDGTTWTKLTTTVVARGLGQAVTWDPIRDRAFIHGGSLLGDPNNPTSFTTIFARDSFRPVFEARVRPAPRSLMVFERDPLRGNIFMFGGLAEGSAQFYYNDSFLYRDGGWSVAPDSLSAPGDCTNPLSAFDTDRGKLVVVCSGSFVYEFDGTTWKEFTQLDPTPNGRRFAAMVYDQKLKKTLLFGGYANSNYRNDTWTWDGAKWAELDLPNDRRPPHRGTMAMWYDPLAQKTILYGGIGRANLNQKVTRYSDMWAFDGTRWTNMNVAQTPGIRFRPLTAINPTTNKVIMFGGLFAEDVGNGAFRQTFRDDMWEWDGSTSQWRQIEQPAYRPSARQNGGLAYDPSTGLLTLFGGYANGFYFSDTWTWNGSAWTPDEASITGRRRSVR